MQGHWTFFRPVRLQAVRKRSVRLVLKQSRLLLTYRQSLGYLRRRAIWEMLQTYPRWRCPSAIMWPDQSAPTEIISMANESRFAPVVLIVPEPLLHGAGEPFSRVLFVLLQIGVREIEIHCRRKNEAIALGHVTKELRRIIDKELVRIEPAPPVPRRRYVPSRFKYFPTELIGERPIVVANKLDLGIAIREFLKRLPGSIDASIVKNEDPIAPFESRFQRLADNVVLVSNATNAEYLHVEDYPWYRRPLPTRHMALSWHYSIHPFSGGILGDRAPIPAPFSS